MKITTSQLIANIVEKNEISENEIKLICRRLNAGEDIDLSDIWNNPIKLTQSQNNKGISFLRNLYQTPKGIERKNNPFGYREISTLHNFENFEFAGVYDTGNKNFSFFVPLYNCIGLNGNFQYYYSSGQINIIG